MMKRLAKSILLAAGFLFLLGGAETSAQVSHGGTPASFVKGLPVLTDVSARIAPPSLQGVAREDSLRPVPYRFAVHVPVDLDLMHDGHLEGSGSEDAMIRLRIEAPGALGIILYFDRFRIPEGGRLFVYDPGMRQVLGAFTSASNKPSGTFATGCIRGSSLILEYNHPEGSGAMPDIHINEIGWAYRGIYRDPGVTEGFGQSGDCEVNVNCPEGDGWKLQKQGVARIQVKRPGGTMWCSGSLVNNVRHDGTPYFLTADHCGRFSSAQDLTQWVFDFNYESPGCPNPPQEPGRSSVTGALLVARGGDSGNTGSDFFLVLLQEEIPETWHLYFNGWDRSEEPSPPGTGIHHPQGDIRKISTYTSPLVSSSWLGHVPGSHWRVVWAETQSGHGVTEPGSSGSPIFNNAGRVVGTLTGGDASCAPSQLDQPDYYGKFLWHWDRNGSDSASVLKYWLDPDNTDIMAIDGWTVGVEEPLPEPETLFHPNPCSGDLTVEPLTAGSYRFVLTDIRGKMHLDRVMTVHGDGKTTLDLSHIPQGIYFLRVGNGRTTMTGKVIKF